MPRINGKTECNFRPWPDRRTLINKAHDAWRVGGVPLGTSAPGPGRRR